MNNSQLERVRVDLTEKNKNKMFFATTKIILTIRVGVENNMFWFQKNIQ